MAKKKKRIVEEPVESTEEAQDPCQELKEKLRTIYDDRPIYVGQEYNALHLWYARVEALLL